MLLVDAVPFFVGCLKGKPKERQQLLFFGTNHCILPPHPLRRGAAVLRCSPTSRALPDSPPAPQRVRAGTGPKSTRPFSATATFVRLSTRGRCLFCVFQKLINCLEGASETGNFRSPKKRKLKDPCNNQKPGLFKRFGLPKPVFHDCGVAKTWVRIEP